MPDILISEIFGPTIQGEGALAGRLTVFVRTGGCDSRCNWCVAPETSILLADGSEKAARDMKQGDQIWGVARRVGVPEVVGPYQVGVVEGAIARKASRVRVAFEDGRELIAAEGHSLTVFGSGRFKTVETLQPGDQVRALHPSVPWDEDAKYRRGYLAGSADGDGSFHFKQTKAVWHFVIATGDNEILDRFANYADHFSFNLLKGRHLSGGQFAPARHINCLRLCKTERVQQFRTFLAAPAQNKNFWRGYLAGIYDTDGSTDGKTWAVTQFKEETRNRIVQCLNELDLNFSTSSTGFRLRGGLGLAKRLARETRSALQRKIHPYFARRGGHSERATVSSVEHLGEGEVVSIKTSLGTYISNGFVSRNCDTLYAVLPQYKADWTKMTAAQIIEKIEEHSFGKPILVTVSGGNPALQPLDELLDLGHARGHSFALETQGTKAPQWLGKIDYLTISPKPPSSGMPFHRDALVRCLELGRSGARTQVSLKVVVFDETDYIFARQVREMFADVPFYLSVGTQPSSRAQGDTQQITQSVEWLIEKVAKDGWNDAVILPQIHVLLWGQKRGV